MGELLGDQQPFEVRLASVFDAVKVHLDERQRRLLLGSMAREIGHGGISLVAAATGRPATPSAGVPPNWRPGSSRMGGSGVRAQAVSRLPSWIRGS